MIIKLGMIILLEHNVDKAVEFYKKLGLKQILPDPWDGADMKWPPD